MIKIETHEGPIFAVRAIDGIPVDPVNPPLLAHINPHRRRQMGVDLRWLRRPWISTAGRTVRVYCLRPAATRPELWGQFSTVQQALAYITDPPSPRPAPAMGDLDF